MVGVKEFLDYVVADVIDYSPYAVAHTYTVTSGAKIVITKDKDGSFLINRGKLVQEDTIATNGVMHTFENVSALLANAWSPYLILSAEVPHGL